MPDSLVDYPNGRHERAAEVEPKTAGESLCQSKCSVAKNHLACKTGRLAKQTVKRDIRAIYVAKSELRQNFAKVAKILRLSQKNSKTNSTKW